MNDRVSRVHVALRMAAIAPFEVMEIQTRARALEAQGRDVIHLEIGGPPTRSTPASPATRPASTTSSSARSLRAS